MLIYNLVIFVQKVRITCHGVAKMNRTYFVNPKFPKTVNEERRCEITVSRPSKYGSVCQLLINFRKFKIAPPVMAVCTSDSFIIPHSSRLPVLCGNNTSQHS